jgi:hypothetical protein
MKPRLLVVAIAALTLQAPETAHAVIASNTIDRHATYTNGGALVRASGPIACTRGERVSIRVTVSQSATAARASERLEHRCTGEVQHWHVRARAFGGKRFESGKAKVCAVAYTRAGRHMTDEKSWCADVSLSPRF